jgi:WD40 repeat protein
MIPLVPSPSRLNPYVGPRPFERGQRLYGRDREVSRLRDLLIAERIVLLYSPSGAGKTSLIRAGLVSKLEQEEGFRVLPEIRVAQELAPDDSAGRPVNRYLMSTLLSLENGRPPECRHDLDELISMGLDSYLDQLDGERDGEVLIFDQFEELLVADLIDQDAKSAFLTELGVALRNRRRWAIFAMREDLVAGLDPYRRLLPTRLRTTFRLNLLGEAEARMAIQGPARQAGVVFSDAAAQRLVDSLRRVRVRRLGTSVDDLGPYVEPVQLQVVCERLWEQPRVDPMCITESDVREVGNVDTALADYYAEKVGAVANTTGMDERAIRDWFDHALVTEQGLRIQALTGPLDGWAEEDWVLRLLEDTHLIRAESRGSARWFELAHDRLIEPVRANNWTWREANLQPFQRQAPLWQRAFQPDHLLLTGEALVEADRWVKAHPAEPTPVEREFLVASHTHQRRTRARWLRIGAAVVAAILLVLALTAVYVALRVRSDALAGQATLLLAQDPAEALGKALEAVRWPSTPQAKTALTSSLAQSHVRTILWGHAGPVERADFSWDGELVVTVGSDRTARTWNAMTGAQRLVLAQQSVTTAQLSPDGSQVVTAGADTTARVWDARTGDERGMLKGHEKPVVSAQFSPDGARVVTASLDTTARVWDAETAGELRVLEGHAGAVLSAQWSLDGSRIVTASQDNTVRVWNPETGEELAKLPGVAASAAMFLDAEHVVAAAAADPADPTGRRLAYLWEWGTNQPPVSFGGRAPALSPDARHILTLENETIRVWHASLGTSLLELRGHEGPVIMARFSPTGAHIVSGGADGTVRIWEVATGQMLVELRGHQGEISDVAFSPHQPDPLRLTVVTASADGTARVWRPSIGRVLSEHMVTHASFSTDGSLVASAGVDGVARVWQSETGEQLVELPSDSPQRLQSVAFSRDGRYIVTGGDDGMVRVWDWERKNLRATTMVIAGGRADAVAFDPSDERIVIVGSDQTAYIWQWRTQRPLQPLRGAVTDTAFSPDGALVVTAGLDGTARIWDLAGEELRTLHGHSGPVYSVAFHPDGRSVFTAGADRTARIWNAGTGDELLPPITGHESELRDAAFSHDGAYLVTAALDGTVGLWEASTGRTLALLQMPSASLTSVQFSPNNNFILTASEDGIARIYHCEVCAPLSDLRELARERLRDVRVAEGLSR